MINSNNLNFYKDSLDYIIKVQAPDGSISWEKDRKLDPWDHVEAAMGLIIGGKEAEARSAFLWLKENQEEDGSWYAQYNNGTPESQRKESNFTAYIATGLWHNYLVSKDKNLLKEMFSTLDLAMRFVVSLQTDFGDIRWAKENNKILDDSLITGCSSIYKSLDCAISIYRTLGHDTKSLVKAKELLKTCLLENVERFDRSWKSKKRYSMDWYYPVMCGVVKGTKAKELFEWLHQWKDPKDNLYWTGYVYTDQKYWPVEKPTWTAAAVLIAADSLFRFTNGSKLFLND